jgi:hypothetical protein
MLIPVLSVTFVALPQGLRHVEKLDFPQRYFPKWETDNVLIFRRSIKSGGAI